jgi:2-polyprenyl-3-methyl-5-hydroxy-6-metoxy-1,4-benzoquinol methylase
VAPVNRHDVLWTPEKIADTWDFFSETLGGSDVYFSSYFGRWIVARADRELGLRTKRVLDFGCGRGDLLGHLFARRIPAQGLEVSEGSAETARERFASEPLFGGVSLRADELEDRSFDVVFLVEVIEHLLDDQIEPVLAEVRRLLSANGHVVVTSPNDENLRVESVRCPDCGGVFHRWQHLRSLNPTSISRLFEEAGFRTDTAAAVHLGRSVPTVVRSMLRRAWRLPKPHLFYIGSAR